MRTYLWDFGPHYTGSRVRYGDRRGHRCRHRSRRRPNERRGRQNASCLRQIGLGSAGFPRLLEHANPQQFAGLVFASLRGMGMFDLFDVDQDEIDGQLEVLAQIIVQVGQSA